MKNKMRRFIEEQRGSIIVMFVIVLVIMIGMAGLVVDGGMLINTKAHLQKTANAAALSGAQRLLTGEAEVKSEVDHILVEHNEVLNLKSLDLTENTITVTLKKDVNLSFMRIFGHNQQTIEVKAKARLGNGVKMKNVAPIGIDDEIFKEIKKEEEYLLKVDTIGAEAGWFGILSLGGAGAKTYAQNLRDGYDGYVNIGDVIDTETGNVAGKTISIIREKVSECSHLTKAECIEENCGRILLIPIYKPYFEEEVAEGDEPNQIKQIQVTGFAFFYVLEQPEAHDTTIRGEFVDHYGTGTAGTSVIDTGVYVINLVE